MSLLKRLGLVGHGLAGFLAGSLLINVLAADNPPGEPTPAPPRQEIKVNVLPFSPTDGFVVSLNADGEQMNRDYQTILEKYPKIDDKAAKRMSISIEELTETLDDYDTVRQKYPKMDDYAASELAAEVAEGHGFVVDENKKVNVLEGVEVSMECYDRIKARLPGVGDDALAVMASSIKGRGALFDNYWIVDDFNEIKKSYKGISDEAAAILASPHHSTGMGLNRFDMLKNANPGLSDAILARMAIW
jgi:hypothetical protein